MKNRTEAEQLVLTYIAARRTERTLKQTRMIARQWRDCVSIASHDGDDIFAVEALQLAQHYNETVGDLDYLLAMQDAEVERLNTVSFVED